VGPKEVVGENGVVTGLKVRACVSVFDENGRFNPAFSDEEKVIPATPWYSPSASRPNSPSSAAMKMSR